MPGHLLAQEHGTSHRDGVKIGNGGPRSCRKFWHGGCCLSAMRKPTTSLDPDAWIDATAPALGLAIDPAWRPGVAANLARMAELAELVIAFPLADDEDAAPVYRP